MRNYSFRYSLLGRWFILYSVIFSSCIAMLLTVIQVYGEYNHELSKHSMYHKIIEQSLLDSLSKSVWIYDDSQIYTQLQGIVNIPSVERAMLILPENVRFNVGEVTANNIQQHRIDVNYHLQNNDQNMGYLIVYSEMDSTYKHLLEFGSFMLLANATKTAFVVLFMLFLFNHLIGRHLTRISNDLALYREGEKPNLISLDRQHKFSQDELDTLVDSINNLQRRVYFEQHNAKNQARQKDAFQNEIIAQKEKLLMLERNVGLSEISRSFAQELRGPLTGIKGYSELCQQQLSATPLDKNSLRRSLDKVRENSLQAVTILERSTEILKSNEPNCEKVDINETIANVLLMLSHNIAEVDIVVKHQTATYPVYVFADELQLEQVLVNLLRNAIEALLEKSGDLLFIEISAITQNNNVVVRIEDNGHGIEKSMQEKLFTPFFSTKNNGLGVGLSLSRILLSGMGGSISLVDKVGLGACFCINLPEFTNQGNAPKN